MAITYEIRGTALKFDSADPYVGVDRALHDLRCLVPYLSVDREATSNVLHWANATGVHCVISITCSPIDEQDMESLITAVCHRYFDNLYVDTYEEVA